MIANNEEASLKTSVANEEGARNSTDVDWILDSVRVNLFRSPENPWLAEVSGSNRNETKTPILSPGIPFWFERGLFTHSDSISKNSARTPLEERETHYRTSTKAALLFVQLRGRKMRERARFGVFARFQSICAIEPFSRELLGDLVINVPFIAPCRFNPENYVGLRLFL